jgi:hypothetical protein
MHTHPKTIKIFVTLFLAIFSLSSILPTMTFGQETAQTSSQQTTQTSGVSTQTSSATQNSQAQAYLGGVSSEGGGASGAVGAISQGVGSCVASGILSRLSKYGIDALAGKLTGVISDMTTNTVPTNESGEVKTNIGLSTSASTVQTIAGMPTGSSWNSIAFCVVNGMIEYITDATIAWANSGFNGKPAFLENPELFFRNLADMEASSFISNIAYNTTGINVCEPFRIQLAIGLAETYGTGLQARRLSCSLDAIQNSFMNSGVDVGIVGSGGVQSSGSSTILGLGTSTTQKDLNLRGYWTIWNEARKPQNNPWGAYIMANDLLYGRITRQDNTARFEIGLNRGWLSYKKCSDPKDPNSCKITTPGTIIESTLNDTLGLEKERLVMATKFDQLVDTIVNNLIKVALNKALESR